MMAINNSALDSKFVTIETTGMEKIYQNSSFFNTKKMNQINSKDKNKKNHSNNNSRNNSKEKTPMNKKESSNSKNIKNSFGNSEKNKENKIIKEIQTNNFTIINIKNNKAEIFEEFRSEKEEFIPKAIFSDKNLSKNLIRAESSQNVFDTNKITFNSKYNLTENSKTLNFKKNVPIDLNKIEFQSNSKIKNSSSKTKNGNSSNSKFNLSYSKNSHYDSELKKKTPEIGKRINSKDKVRNGSSKHKNFDSFLEDSVKKNHNILTNDEKINKNFSNAKTMIINQLTQKQYNQFHSSTSNKSNLSKKKNYESLVNNVENHREEFSNDTITYLNTDSKNKITNHSEKESKNLNPIKLNISKNQDLNTINITKNLNSNLMHKYSKNCVNLNNINLNNISSYLDKFNKSRKKENQKLEKQNTIETTSTNKCSSTVTPENNFSTSRILMQNEMDNSNILYTIQKDCNLNGNTFKNLNTINLDNCDISNTTSINFLGTEYIKKMKNSFKDPKSTSQIKSPIINNNDSSSNTYCLQNSNIYNNSTNENFSLNNYKSTSKIKNINSGSLQNSSLNNSLEKINKLYRNLTNDNNNTNSHYKFIIKSKNIDNNNNNLTLKNYDCSKEKSRESRNNSITKNSENTYNNKSKSKGKCKSKSKCQNISENRKSSNNKKPDFHESINEKKKSEKINKTNIQNLITPMLTKENINKLSFIKSPNNNININKNIDFSNFNKLDLDYNSLNNGCSTAKALKSTKVSKVSDLKKSNSKSNLKSSSNEVEKNVGTEILPKEDDEFLIKRRNSKNKLNDKSKDHIMGNNEKNSPLKDKCKSNKINNINNDQVKFTKGNLNNIDKIKSFEKTININHNFHHNFNHNINHNILINIENPEGIKTESFNGSIKKFYPKKNSTIENINNSVGAITSKNKQSSNIIYNLNNDEENSEINYGYLETDNPSIYGSNNKVKNIMKTLESAKDNYMNLKSNKNILINDNSINFVKQNNKDAYSKNDNYFDTNSKEKKDFEKLYKKPNSNLSNKNTNILNTNVITNEKNSSTKKISNKNSNNNNYSNSVNNNTANQNKIFENEITNHISNKLMNKYAIKVNMDKNSRNFNELKNNLEANNIMFDNKNNKNCKNSLKSNEAHLDLSIKKSPISCESDLMNVSTKLNLDNLKRNLLVKKETFESTSNKSKALKEDNSDVSKNKIMFDIKSNDSEENFHFERDLFITEPNQSSKDKEELRKSAKITNLKNDAKLKMFAERKNILNYNTICVNNNLNNKKDVAEKEIKKNEQSTENSRNVYSPNNDVNVTIKNFSENINKLSINIPQANLNLASKIKNNITKNENFNQDRNHNNFATICNDNDIKLRNDLKKSEIPQENKNKFMVNEKLNLFNIHKKLNVAKNKNSIFETLDIKKKPKKKSNNHSNNILTDEESNADGCSKNSKKTSNKFHSQSFKYSSSSKSHSNSQNKESLHKDRDLLEETISYIISDDELSSRRNKNDTIVNTEESQQKNIYHGHFKINNSNDEVDFEKFYEEINMKLMNNHRNSNN